MGFIIEKFELFVGSNEAKEKKKLKRATRYWL